MKLAMRLTMDGLVRGLRLRAHRVSEAVEARSEPAGRDDPRRPTRTPVDERRQMMEMPDGLRRT
jgi:hypothetical protein